MTNEKLKREIEKKYKAQKKVWMRVSDDYSIKAKKVPIKKIIREYSKLTKLSSRYNKLLKK